MKHKTADLEGVLLDSAVAKAEGETWEWAPPYSSLWERGGPIIERERIAILPYAHEGEYEYDEAGNNPRLIAPSRWWAKVMEANTGGWIEVCPEHEEGSTSDDEGRVGPTPLIAAMRAYVASRFGEEIELP